MFQLREQEQQTLLRIAREAVAAHLSNRAPSFPDIPEVNLAEIRAVFVSIHQGQRLRGCVGNLQPEQPLCRTTAECAVAAAVSDPRFPPMKPAELPRVNFEVSVLEPFERINDPSEIEIGKHGLIVSQDRAVGLLLPQVATQFGWNSEQFLAGACQKAGLRPDDWKRATIQRFTAQVFGETQ